VVVDLDKGPQQHQKCVPLHESEWRWRDGDHIDHHDVFLPVSWHLNMEKVLVLPMPKKGERLTVEIHHRINNLPLVVCF
jgi:hypothetical protein